MCAQPVVLVVEDEPILRLSVESELTARGWPVAAAATGEDALALTKERDIGVVFTDIQIGGKMSGWEVAEALRKLRPGIPVLYASGTAHDHSQAVEGGVFFAKPYDLDQVIATAARLCGV